MTMATIQRIGRRRGRRPGFTLAEVLICAMLLAIGFIALLAAYGQETGTVARSEEMTLAVSLADEIRDAALGMTFAQVRALDGADYTPAHLSTGASNDLADWEQVIRVTSVQLKDLTRTDASGNPKAVQLTVTVKTRQKTVLVQSYYFFDPSAVIYTDGKTRT
jgi:type II secretory pathway pseudopilin PulG